MAHPSVREAALIGVPDPALGQQPVAYVTARDGDTPDTETLVEFVNRRLERLLPKLSVLVLAEMPMTPTGKISKAQLLQQQAQS